jgi:hypothetical protein
MATNSTISVGAYAGDTLESAGRDSRQPHHSAITSIGISSGFAAASAHGYNGNDLFHDRFARSRSRTVMAV